MVSPEVMDALGVYGGGSSRSELSKPCCDGGEDTVKEGAVAGLGENGFDEGIWKLGEIWNSDIFEISRPQHRSQQPSHSREILINPVTLFIACLRCISGHAGPHTAWS